MTTDLPALPEPFEVNEWCGQNINVYDAGQMHAYGVACADAATVRKSDAIQRLWRERDELRAALAAQQPAAPYTRERHFALREAHCIGASDAYFKAWPTHDNDAGRMLFERGFVRGFDSAVRWLLAAAPAVPQVAAQQPAAEPLTADKHFRLSDDEIKALQTDPRALALLMDHHDALQTEADAIWGTEDGCPQGNALRRQALYERGRSIVAEDLDVWPDDLRREFGFPAYAAPAVQPLDDSSGCTACAMCGAPAGQPAPEAIGWAQLGTLEGKTYLRMVYDRTPYPPPADVVRNLNLVPVYSFPAWQLPSVEWPRLLQLINEYASHVTDAAMHQAESRADISKSAALKTMGEIRRAIEGEPTCK